MKVQKPKTKLDWTEKNLPRTTCGLYYKSFVIVIYDRNHSGQYYKATIRIIIYQANL
jgi:hypothetical protein